MDWLTTALKVRFTRVSALDVAKMDFSGAAKIRKLCEDNVCGSYATNWTCPPGVGAPEECVAQIKKYNRAYVVQYEEPLEDLTDSAEVSRVRSQFKILMRGFLPAFRREHPDFLALGAGGCEICAKCAYPGAPCRNPDKMIQSLSAFCVDAQQACDLAGLPCWRKGYLAFTGMYFIDKR